MENGAKNGADRGARLSGAKPSDNRLLRHSNMPRTMLLTIATRESRLALWQAEHVKTLLQQQGHAAALLGMTTLMNKLI